MSSPEPDFIYSSNRSSYRPDNGVRTKKRRFDKDMTYGADPYPHGGYRSFRQNKNEPREQIIISNLPMHASDSVVKDGLFHEFKRFGHVTIYLRGRAESRTATITYRNPDDTFKVKQHFDRRGKLILFDRQVHIDFETEFERNAERSFSPESYNSLSPRRSYNKNAGRNFRAKEDIDRDLRYEEPNNYRSRDRGDFRDPPKRYSYDNYQESSSIPVEDDPKASRTLFVGGLETAVSANELRRIFEPFGHVEDVEVKRPTHPQGTTYAFVKFLDIDVAARAKACVDGQFIGRKPCKIGYGRSIVSTRLWVGGLGSWTSIEELTREFDRFGAIKFIDFVKGNNFAYILYDSLDAACVAAREMHGYPLGGHDRRLKIDFASPEKTRNEFDQFNDFERPDANYERNSSARGRGGNYQWEQRGGRKYNDDKQYHQRGGEKKWHNSHGDSFSDHNVRSAHHGYEHRRGKEHGIPEDDRIGRKRTRSVSPAKESAHAHSSKRHESHRSHRRHASVNHREEGFSSAGKQDRYERLSSSPSKSAKRNSSSSADREYKNQPQEPNDNDVPQPSPTEKSDNDKVEKNVKQENGSDVNNKMESIVDVAKRFAVAWRGAFALKTSAFPLRMHLVGGNPELADALLRAVGQGKVLSISQRLRLDQPKLEEVSRRVITAGASGHCILLALPILQTGWEDLDLDKSFQLRSLRSLVVYLKQKQAAGVIPLLNDQSAGQKDEGGILHAFPPCDYSHQQLLKVAPNLGPEPSKEDHLVMILVRGGA